MNGPLLWTSRSDLFLWKQWSTHTAFLFGAKYSKLHLPKHAKEAQEVPTFPLADRHIFTDAKDLLLSQCTLQGRALCVLQKTFQAGNSTQAGRERCLRCGSVATHFTQHLPGRELHSTLRQLPIKPCAHHNTSSLICQDGSVQVCSHAILSPCLRELHACEPAKKRKSYARA